MRVFVTGATGFIGSAVVRELLDAGHGVLGLARSDAGASALAAAGAEVHLGDLDDVASLRAGAAEVDGALHLAFVHDFSRYEAATRTDRQAIEAIGATLAGSGRPFVVTSGSAVLTPGRVVTEDDEPDLSAPTSARSPSEGLALSFADRGVRVSVLRLPPTVHGAGDHGFVPAIIASARANGVASYVDDGANRWAAVHRHDAARLYRLALEHAPAGARLHAIGEEGVPMRAIAEVIGRHLNVPVTSISRDEAADTFGWLSGFVGMDCPASSARTRKELGWEPVGQGLLADLEEGHYFAR
jgi:nucleoside-diphosphate-sugar epimerase